jgi:anthranilate synthase/aminodeoxychorismate synthase-like glutamine amidotransferase
MILVIDNYDSFTFNLVDLIERLGARCDVVRHDQVDLAGVVDRAPAGCVLSPGPCTPDEAGVSMDVCHAALRGALAAPLLGVCLGHQAIAQAAGGLVRRAARPVHGKTSRIFHAEREIFAGLPQGFEAARYNSLVVEPATVPAELEITAWTADGEVMALGHRTLPIDGVQFHPESFMTPLGARIVGHWLGRVVHGRRARRGASERPRA